MKKSIRILTVLMLVAMLFTAVASASSAYSTYTYSSTGFVLESPDAYTVDTIIDSSNCDMPDGVSFAKPTDIVVDKDHVYIMDADRATLFILDSYYKYEDSISNFVNSQGVSDGLTNPQGVFVNDKYIYICDTDNSRIVMFDKATYEFVKTVDQPVSNLFEEGSIYKPVAVAVDTYGRLFIVSSTTTQGIIVMGDNGEFYGFIGAQKVTGGTGLSAFWEKFRSEEQKANEDQQISKEYNNITIDSDNFIYVTTSTIDEEVQQANITSSDGTYAPVKKFNASGTDVLRRNGFCAPSGEWKISDSKTAEYQGASTIVDAAVGPEGTWSIVDQKRSKIFTYDLEGNLLFAFGDMGQLQGNMAQISAIVYQGDKLIVLDKSNVNFTVFRRTEYGDILINALKNQNDRNYEAAEEDWRTILQRNNNFDVAYIGIGKSLQRDGNYREAMEYFKFSHEKENRYAKAYKEIRKEAASKYFILIPIVIVLICVGISTFLTFVGKVNKKASLKVGTKSIWEELAYGFHVMVHPFDGFWDLKHEKRGSLRSGVIILLVTVLAYFYQAIGTGYIFAGDKTGDTTSIYNSVLYIVVPVLLWVISNWCLTTLFDGEGKFTDIFTATCYALFPLPLFVIPSVIFSNILLPDEAAIINVFVYIGMGWAVILLIIGMMSTHGYSIGKNILICVCTIVGMFFIMFIASLFSTLMGKIVALISNIWIEISYRV